MGAIQGQDAVALESQATVVMVLALESRAMVVLS